MNIKITKDNLADWVLFEKGLATTKPNLLKTLEEYRVKEMRFSLGPSRTAGFVYIETAQDLEAFSQLITNKIDYFISNGWLDRFIGKLVCRLTTHIVDSGFCSRCGEMADE